MQRAELEVQDQHMRSMIRAHDVACELQRVHAGVAAHKADNGPLDRWLESVMLDNFDIEARCIKARAGRQDQVSNVILPVNQMQAVQRTARKGERMRPV